MYDRAPRALTKGSDSTGAAVGPGTYDAVDVPPARIKAGRFAAVSNCYWIRNKSFARYSTGPPMYLLIF